MIKSEVRDWDVNFERSECAMSDAARVVQGSL